MSEKTKGQTLKDELFYKKKNVFEVKTPEELAAGKEYGKNYAAWLDNVKTEREAVKNSIVMLEKEGYRDFSRR